MVQMRAQETHQEIVSVTKRAVPPSIPATKKWIRSWIVSSTLENDDGSSGDLFDDLSIAELSGFEGENGNRGNTLAPEKRFSQSTVSERNQQPICGGHVRGMMRERKQMRVVTEIRVKRFQISQGMVV